ncbi:uncharacterized protein Bfra_006132 [Botrytis fragariae]|uniref:Uncharacterized protein n=1 Tax=Botrytis fragariae TaxID=1964551 RepID=A0A8H6ASD8_9HELO|nr:uncharacterized protein Bfra_006132 [Botrytis fragariae]KAF5872769.1 hypothetical protein Bfra_006132 [Botrytis fragariae]
MNQPVNNNQPGHPAPMNRRPRLARRDAEEHVPLTRQAQRARYYCMFAADRAMESARMVRTTRTFGSVTIDARFPGGASRDVFNTGAVQVTGNAQAVGSAQATANAQTFEVIHTFEITRTVEITHTTQTAEAGLDSLTGNSLTRGSSTTTSSASTISSVVVVDAPAFGATGTSSSSTGGRAVAMHENSHEQDGNVEEESDHVFVDHVTGSSANGDMLSRSS